MSPQSLRDGCSGSLRLPFFAASPASPRLAHKSVKLSSAKSVLVVQRNGRLVIRRVDNSGN
jgi:hypothetical protein